MARILILIFLIAFALRFGGTHKEEPTPTAPKPIAVLHGKASYYGPGFHGQCMANGLRFNQEALVAAHRSLPYGTKLLVHYGERTVPVTVMDWGPREDIDDGTRIIDLSVGAARALGMIHDGVVPVTIEVLSVPERSETYHHQNRACLKQA